MDYRELLLLRAARETGVLDALVSSADTPAEVAETAGVTERAAELTVDALRAMGLLERVGDAVEPTNLMLGFITKTDVRSVGSLPHELDRVESLVALPETMRTGDPPEPRRDATRNRLGARAPPRTTRASAPRSRLPFASGPTPTPCSSSPTARAARRGVRASRLRRDDAHRPARRRRRPAAARQRARRTRRGRPSTARTDRSTSSSTRASPATTGPRRTADCSRPPGRRSRTVASRSTSTCSATARRTPG